ncbi:MAG: GIY-YIG nuclease family protein [Patescibacteria group bacterium]
MAFVYILKSRSDGRFYIGSTVDLKKRLNHHIGGFTPSTKRMGEIDLVLCQDYPTLKMARSIERKLKNLKRHDYIEKIVKEGRIRMGG